MTKEKSGSDNQVVQDGNKPVSIWLALGIFCAPYLFSWLILEEGYSKLAKRASFAWLALFIAVIFTKEFQGRGDVPVVAQGNSESVSDPVEPEPTITEVLKTPEERFVEHFPVCAVRELSAGNFNDTHAYRFSVGKNLMLTVEELCIRSDIPRMCDTSGFKYKDSYQMQFTTHDNVLQLRGPTVLHPSFTSSLPSLNWLHLRIGINDSFQPKLQPCNRFE